MKLFPVEMASDRLSYERVHPDDTDPYEVYQYVHTGAPNIDEITNYMPWNPCNHPKEADDWIQKWGEKFNDGEGALYILRPTAGDQKGDFAGIAGIRPDWNVQSATLGMWLRKPFWGRGYSEERAARMLELAFDRLDLEVVAVTHVPENENARQAIQRYVTRFDGQREGLIRNDTLIDGEPRDSIRYSITRDEWERNC